MLTFQISVSRTGDNDRKNNICGQYMYILRGEGRENSLLNLYYTNIHSLKHNDRTPKITVTESQLKIDEIDLVALTETGLCWYWILENKVKRQLRAVKGSTVLATLNVDNGDLGYLTGYTLTITLRGITGCVVKKGKDK